MISRRTFLSASAAIGALNACTTPIQQTIYQEPPLFEANWDSLIEGYSTPDWFKDAKFGVWSHWSAQCYPEQGDWYARKMYEQNTRFYEHHIKTYGHPSKFGFMEINNLWKAENWDPEYLIKRFKNAGAKYFVTLANHHDNFDNYNSRHHAWNSVNIGPKRDIVGTWEKLARANGLKFGVSNHTAHAWHWFQTAYAYDAEGPMANKRYDAYHLTKEDGVGKWWEGLDPQKLYGGRSFVPPDGISSIEDMKQWHLENDRVWREEPPANNPAFVENWGKRCRDLIDSYKPDLLYFDNYDLPLGQIGLEMAAHYYNSSLKWHNGQMQAVINIKKTPADRLSAVVDDVERGLRDEISPFPWQTCTCIGDWHYDRFLYLEKRYKTASWVAKALCDTVSKNGSLLLSIPMRGDGSIDAEEEKFLDEFGPWIQKNGEAIYETRPWKVYGENPLKIGNADAFEKSSMFNESKQEFNGNHVRFTTRGNTLYAMILGWPDNGVVHIKTLAKSAKLGANAKIESVNLVDAGAVEFNHTSHSLQVQLPNHRKPEFVHSLRIEGRGLV